MGYEIAGAFGVKMAEPNKEVYALLSDGSFLMLNSELITSLQESLKINVIIFDNGGFQSINSLQKEHGSEKGFGNELRYRSDKSGKLDGDYLKIDFAGIAKSLGLKSFTVRTIDELKKALKQSRDEKISTLIDIKIKPGTQSGGYGSWWRVGVAEISENEKVMEAYKRDHDYFLKNAKKF